MKHTSDIDRFAKQAGFPARRAFSDLSDLYPRLERFAALIDDAHSKRTFDEGFVTVGHMRERIAAERNKLAQWMIDRSYATGHGDTTEDLLDELDWQITESWSKVVMASVESERKACASEVWPTETKVWSEEELQAMTAAFNRAQEKHGWYETLMAVGASVLKMKATAIRARGQS